MKIESGIPSPKPATVGRPSKYPFRKMEIGDSFLTEGTLASSRGCPAYGAAKVFGSRNNMKFVGKAQGDGTVRIWRIA